MPESQVDQVANEARLSANHRLDRVLVGSLTFGVGGLMVVLGAFSLWFWARGASIDIGPSSRMPAICVSIFGLILIGLGGVAVRR